MTDAESSSWRTRWSSRRAATAEARATILSVVLTQILANGVGAVIVLIYLRLLFPTELRNSPDEARLSSLVFLGYLAVIVAIGLPLNVVLLRRAVSWVREEREPTDHERRLTFALPLLESATSLISWIGGALIFGFLVDSAYRIALGIALAGLVTSALVYLLMEGNFRPVFARALRNAEITGNRRDVLPRIMLAWWIGSAVPLLALGVTPLVIPAVGQLDRVRLTILIVSSLIAGGVVMRLAAASVARPINRVRQALGSVALGNLEAAVDVDDLGELGRLAEGFNDMVDGLREREALRDRIGRQVGIDADRALDARLGDGEHRDVTVLFVDLNGYATYAERHRPEDVVALLNRFFTIVVDVIHRNDGFVNKFEGDAALCVFGAPADQPDHADRALRSAAALAAELRKGDQLLPACIGVASGNVLAGHIGTTERYEYTVIGDVVNVSARLCEEAKTSGVQAFADSSTVLAAADTDAWIDAGHREIRGRAGTAHLYRFGG